MNDTSAPTTREERRMNDDHPGESWSGQWVAERLDVRLRTTDGLPGVELSDLVGLAVRRNPRRAHLLVSQVLGKHVPVDPDLVHQCGLLLGELARRRLLDVAVHDGRGLGAFGDADTAGDEAAVGRALHAYLTGASDVEVLRTAVDAFRRATPEHADAIVLGYAETATGLGQCVAEALRAPVIHSTRRPVEGFEPVGAFEEEHSHATSHLVLPSDDGMLGGGRALVLVDDELSTGRTVLNTIAALHAHHPRSRYVVASLVDLRSDADREAMARRAGELGVMIDVVALACGEVDLPDGVLERGQEVVRQIEGDAAAATEATKSGPGPGEIVACEVVGCDIDWLARVPVTARHGLAPAAAASLEDGLEGAAASVLHALGDISGEVLVLGTEELMYAPLRLATTLKRIIANQAVSVRYSTTTRSPVLAVDDVGYAIRTAVTFPAFDGPADGPGPRFAYNVSRETPWNAIVLCVDPACDEATMRAPGGVLDVLASCAERVVLARLPEPDVAPAAALTGPRFGSYPADDVTWLLKDLSGVELEAPTEEREEAIQSGGAHYAESLPVEYQPDEAYQALFHDALSASSERVAEAVAAVTELALAQRGDGLVLVSLARAGTPVGVLMKRWARAAHGLDVPHYAVSIVRGRGIDTVALDHIAARHDAASVLFVDGWTGKGAITRELADALDGYAAATGVRFGSELAVLADTGSCTTIWGTRDDFLIPSACLNSTVSGLVSRTVLNDDLIGPGEFHGAKFYAELADADVSNLFVDTIESAFPDAGDSAAIRARAEARCAGEPPRWSGWATVEKLSEEFGIGSVNLVKPGVGETTRVLLRRVPWKVLVAPGVDDDVRHIRALADARGVPVETYPGLDYSCVGIIHPQYTRGAMGSDGTAAGQEEQA